MVVRASLGDAEPDRNFVEEQRIRERHAMGGAEIIAGAEEKLVAPRPEGIALERRTVQPAVGIGEPGAEVIPAAGAKPPQLHRQPRRRLSERGIENVRGQTTQERPLLRQARPIRTDEALCMAPDYAMRRMSWPAPCIGEVRR